MADIGTFTQTQDGGYTGAIATLFLNVKSAQFRVNASENPAAPDFRIFAGHAELGAAWKHSKDGRDYLSVKLDDPSLKSEINAILVQGDDDGFKLVWNRQRKVRKPRRARRTET